MLKRGLVVTVAVAVLSAGCAGDPTQSTEFQEVEADLAGARSELADTKNAARAAAETSQSELDTLQTEADRLEVEIDDARASRRAASESYEHLADLIETHVAFAMWIAPEDIEDMQNLGVDTSVADRIIEQRDWGSTWEQFALSGGGFTINRLIAQLDDEVLEAAWVSFFDAPMGSDEEYVALSSFLLRLHEMTIESLQDTDRLLSSPQEDSI